MKMKVNFGQIDIPRVFSHDGQLPDLITRLDLRGFHLIMKALDLTQNQNFNYMRDIWKAIIARYFPDETVFHTRTYRQVMETILADTDPSGFVSAMGTACGNTGNFISNGCQYLGPSSFYNIRNTLANAWPTYPMASWININSTTGIPTTRNTLHVNQPHSVMISLRHWQFTGTVSVAATTIPLIGAFTSNVNPKLYVEEAGDMFRVLNWMFNAGGMARPTSATSVATRLWATSPQKGGKASIDTSVKLSPIAKVRDSGTLDIWFNLTSMPEQYSYVTFNYGRLVSDADFNDIPWVLNPKYAASLIANLASYSFSGPHSSWVFNKSATTLVPLESNMNMLFIAVGTAPNVAADVQTLSEFLTPAISETDQLLIRTLGSGDHTIGTNSPGLTVSDYMDFVSFNRNVGEGIRIYNVGSYYNEFLAKHEINLPNQPRAVFTNDWYQSVYHSLGSSLAKRTVNPKMTVNSYNTVMPDGIDLLFPIPGLTQAPGASNSRMVEYFAPLSLRDAIGEAFKVSKLTKYGV